MTEDDLINAVNAYNETGSQREAAKKLGIPRSTLRDRLRKASLSGLDDLALQKAPFGHSIKGISTLYDSEGNIKSQWIKTRTNEPSYEDLAGYFMSAFADINGKSIATPAPLVDTDLMNVYPIADLHVGMLSWAEETDEDYDIRIVERLTYDVFGRLLKRSPNAGIALIEQLGDFLHSNDYKNMTPTSGNILDLDTRYQKMIYVGARILRNVIELALDKHETVIVRNVAGNHDPASMVALNVALSMYYSSNPRVIIEDSPKQLWAMTFGNTLIGCHHGHSMKPERAAMALACTYSEEWGRCKFRTIHSGHIHHTKVIEVGNVLCESFETIAAKDSYAASHGYVAGRSLQAITYHRELGEVGRSRVNI